jgi:hypothetical protein
MFFFYLELKEREKKESECFFFFFLATVRTRSGKKKKKKKKDEKHSPDKLALSSSLKDPSTTKTLSPFKLPNGYRTNGPPPQ